MLKPGDLILCTVKKIEGTTVFVDIEGEGEGTITTAEIAAGRIRNMNDYVTINKKIVCKVVELINNHPNLSLRRVTAAEKDSVMEKFQKEKNFLALVKTIVPSYEKILEKIKEKYELSEFYDLAREDTSLLEKFFKKEDLEKLKKVFSEKKEKEKEVRRIITLSTLSESGLKEIKYALDSNADIKYLGSSKFSVGASGKDFKQAEAKLSKALTEIEKRSKEKKINLKIEEKAI